MSRAEGRRYKTHTGNRSARESFAAGCVLGVVFPNAVVARVRIEYGNHALGPKESARVNVAVMDDFIYGEPQP